MMFSKNCPICQSKISEERTQRGLIICHSCGWSDKVISKNLEKKATRIFVGSTVVIAALFIGSFIQSIQWNHYSLEIIPPKTKQIIGMANHSDLRHISQICEELNKFPCLEEVYSDMLKRNSEDLPVWGLYGRTLIYLGKSEEALEAFGNYFTKGGDDLDVAFSYAKILGSAGYIDEATEYFQYIMEAKPGVLQVTVGKRFVEMLYNAGRYKEAQKVIFQFRKRGLNADYFMEKSLQKIRSAMEEA